MEYISIWNKISKEFRPFNLLWNDYSRKDRRVRGDFCVHRMRNLQLASVDNIAYTNLARLVQTQIDSQEWRLSDRLTQHRIFRQTISTWPKRGQQNNRERDKKEIGSVNMCRTKTKNRVESIYFRRVRRGSCSGLLMPVVGSIVVKTHLSIYIYHSR